MLRLNYTNGSVDETLNEMDVEFQKLEKIVWKVFEILAEYEKRVETQKQSK